MKKRYFTTAKKMAVIFEFGSIFYLSKDDANKKGFISDSEGYEFIPYNSDELDHIFMPVFDTKKEDAIKSLIECVLFSIKIND